MGDLFDEGYRKNTMHRHKLYMSGSERRYSVLARLGIGVVISVVFKGLAFDNCSSKHDRIMYDHCLEHPRANLTTSRQ